MVNYTEDSIKTLDWNVHLRERPGMYIGRLGDGSSHDDGIYVLMKEVLDNCIDEFMHGFGKTIEVSIKEDKVTVRDYGRGIPLKKMVDCVSKINTGGKFDYSNAYSTSIGMNGVGVKATNALSSFFKVNSFVEGKEKSAEFSEGIKLKEHNIEPTKEQNGTCISFIPDKSLFVNFHWYNEYIEKMMWNYVYLNRGLTIICNGIKYASKNGLLDLINNNVSSDSIYPPIHLKENDFECALVHTNRKYGEEYYSFVNSQYTIYGGTHQQAFREAIVNTLREFFKKDFDPSDVRNSIVAALSIRVKNPSFEAQTKTKLGSQYMEPSGQTVRNYVHGMISNLLDKYLHMNPEVADAILKKILESEKERKEIAGIKKGLKEVQKKVSLHNKKLRDCKYHFNTNYIREEEKQLSLETQIFITEGDSASGSITSSRNVNTQAVFSLKGKPMNTLKSSKKDILQNEEFSLLQAALNIDDGLDGLRYNNIIIATDADSDGMHIRNLLLTYFLKYCPDLIKAGHVYILQTPLFRVRNKLETHYCYSEDEKQNAIKKLGGKPEITRFKGLGEIDPKEFKNFIGTNMRADPIVLDKKIKIDDMLEFFMGTNDDDRRQFIMERLRDEIDVA